MRLPPFALLAAVIALSACSPQAPGGTDNAMQAPITSGDDASEGSIHNLPVPAGVQAARVALAAKLGVDASDILILEAHEKDWSDSCLGLGGPAESCLAAITPGYDVLMTYDGVEYRYRTDADGTSVREDA